MTYLRGNHGINITQDDLKRIPCGDYFIKLVPDIYTQGRVTYTHGHLYTFYNAPPIFTSPISPPPPFPNYPPSGHFVTRALSRLVMSKLGPGQTIADLPNWGIPDGAFSFLEDAALSITRSGGDINQIGLVQILLDHMAQTCGVGALDPITLLDGQQSSFARAKQIYANQGLEWVVANGGETGRNITYKAVWADKDGRTSAGSRSDSGVSVAPIWWSWGIRT